MKSLPLVLLAALALGPALSPPDAVAQTVWSGYDVFFEKVAYADPSLPENQDRITDNVRITRASVQGLFNAAQEENYTRFVSPVGTEWATGTTANWASLTFADWLTWNGGNPPGVVGLNAVVHLIAEDIYLDIRMDSWNRGSTTGGGFSYYRAAEPAATAVETTGWSHWARVKELYR